MGLEIAHRSSVAPLLGVGEEEDERVQGRALRGEDLRQLDQDGDARPIVVGAFGRGGRLIVMGGQDARLFGLARQDTARGMERHDAREVDEFPGVELALEAGGLQSVR
jgi:hypothetical protein